MVFPLLSGRLPVWVFSRASFLHLLPDRQVFLEFCRHPSEGCLVDFPFPDPGFEHRQTFEGLLCFPGEAASRLLAKVSR